MALRKSPTRTPAKGATWQDVPPNPNPWGPRPKPFRVFMAPKAIVKFGRAAGAKRRGGDV